MPGSATTHGGEVSAMLSAVASSAATHAHGLLHHLPDLAVVGDRRQEPQERGDDDGQAPTRTPEGGATDGRPPSAAHSEPRKRRAARTHRRLPTRPGRAEDRVDVTLDAALADPGPVGDRGVDDFGDEREDVALRVR